MELQPRDKAPDFELADQNGNVNKLSDFLGKKVLLYFYPRDFTAGCTIEACQMREGFPKFTGVNAVVIGISTDSVDSHKRFVQKYSLPFTLLADTNKEVVKKYDVWRPKKFLGREFLGVVRTSFLIDETGKIEKIYEKVKPAIHAQEVLEDLENGIQKPD